MQQIIPLKPYQLPELYGLMVLRNFPHVPSTFKQAEPYLTQARIYGLFNRGRLKAGFIFGEIEEGGAFFDVVCQAEMKGRWATCAILRQLYQLAFSELGLRFVWSEPHNQQALKAALHAGFVLVSQGKGQPLDQKSEPHFLETVLEELVEAFLEEEGIEKNLESNLEKAEEYAPPLLVLTPNSLRKKFRKGR